MLAATPEPNETPSYDPAVPGASPEFAFAKQIEADVRKPGPDWTYWIETILRYSTLIHALLQFALSILFALYTVSESNINDWIPERVNICMAMFLMVPTLMLGFSSTGKDFSHDTKFKAVIIFLVAYVVFSIVAIVLNIWITIATDITGIIAIAINGFFLPMVTTVSAIRIAQLRKALAEDRSRNITSDLVAEQV
jgi:hypothetical protein